MLELPEAKVKSEPRVVVKQEPGVGSLLPHVRAKEEPEDDEVETDGAESADDGEGEQELDIAEAQTLPGYIGDVSANSPQVQPVHARHRRPCLVYRLWR